MLNCFRRSPIKNGLNSFGIDSNALTRDYMAEISHFWQPKFALGELGIKAVLSEFF